MTPKFYIVSSSLEFPISISHFTIPGLNSEPQKVYSKSGPAFVESYSVEYDNLTVQIPFSWATYLEVQRAFCDFDRLGTKVKTDFDFTLVVDDIETPLEFRFFNAHVSSLSSLELGTGEWPNLEVTFTYDFYTVGALSKESKDSYTYFVEKRNTKS